MGLPRISSNPFSIVGAEIILDPRYFKLDGSNSGLTAGSVVFVGASGQLSQNNTNFYWDNVNKYLGIGPNQNFVGGTGKPIAPISMLTTLTGTTGNIYGALISLTVNSASSNNANNIALASEILVPTGNAQNYTNLVFGQVFNIEHYGSGIITAGYGIQGKVNNRAGGTITNARGTYMLIQNLGVGTITNAYGFYIDTPTNSGGGTISNYTGLYVNTPVGTNKYAGVFLGNVGIGTATPGTLLALSQSQSGFTTPGSTARQLALIDTNGSFTNLTEIGFGVQGATYQPLTIGSRNASGAGNSKAAFYVAVRDVTTDTAPAEVFTVDTTGNVGIGKTIPGNVLHIYNALPLIQYDRVGNYQWLAGVDNGTYSNNSDFIIYDSGVTALRLVVRAVTGLVGIGISGPGSRIHITAGSATANTAPLQFSSGALETVARAGVAEYNGNLYFTQGGIVRYSIGGTLFDHFADAGSTSTNGTFDDLYSDTTAANTFNTNGDKIKAEYGGIFVASASATRDIKVLFAGTTILDTGALTTATADSFYVTLTIIRESATVVRCQATIVASTTLGAQAFNDTTYTRITGLTLSGTNILKIQGAAAGAGAAANDIVAKHGSIRFQPAI